MRDWDERYRNGDLPWETGRVDAQLVRVIDEYGVRPCEALDFGCGTGNNAIWLAQNGFTVTALDISELAIDKAIRKTDAELNVRYISGDIHLQEFLQRRFGFVFDRGCFHSMQTVEDRQKCAARIHSILEDGGLWLSLIGNADQPEREIGPPRLTALDIVSVIEPYFEILQLKSGFFDSDQPDPARCWLCLMRRRA